VELLDYPKVARRVERGTLVPRAVKMGSKVFSLLDSRRKRKGLGRATAKAGSAQRRVEVTLAKIG